MKRCAACLTINTPAATSCGHCGRSFPRPLPRTPARHARAAREERDARHQRPAELAHGQRCTACPYPGSLLVVDQALVCAACGTAAAA